MDSEKKLTDHIVRKYDPVAVVLHGSRASGYARTHSDWDFAILVNKDTEVEREIIDGMNFEIRALKLPYNEKSIKDGWIALREGNTKILFDPTDITKDIINAITKHYNTPRVWKNSEIFAAKAWFRSQIDGMIDYQDDQLAFFRKLGELYLKAMQGWFHFIHNEYMPQVYKSLPRIKTEDPEYYMLLTILSSNDANQEKIKAAEEIYKRVWK